MSIYLWSIVVHIWSSYYLYKTIFIRNPSRSGLCGLLYETTLECAQPNWPNLGWYTIFGSPLAILIEALRLFIYVPIYYYMLMYIIGWYTLLCILHNDRCLHHIPFYLDMIPSSFSLIAFYSLSYLILHPYLPWYHNNISYLLTT